MSVATLARRAGRPLWRQALHNQRARAYVARGAPELLAVAEREVLLLVLTLCGQVDAPGVRRPAGREATAELALVLCLLGL